MSMSARPRQLPRQSPSGMAAKGHFLPHAPAAKAARHFVLGPPRSRLQTCRLGRDSIRYIAVGVTPLGADQMAIGIGRRQFISALGGAAAVWSFVAHAQQPERKWRIGVLMNKTPADSQGRDEISAFESVLQERGWRLGGNLQVDYRWGAGDANQYRKFAAELVALAPDLLFGAGGTVVGALQQATRDVPIVFVETTDPVDAWPGRKSVTAWR